MQITISNQQKLIKLKNSTIKRLAVFFVTQIEQHTPFHYSNLNILFVDYKKIRNYKLAFFNKNESTDVITIPHSASPSNSELSADIIISVETAIREANKRNISYEEEIGLYLAHAIDHLAGSNDNTPSKRKTMLTREKLWLKKAKQQFLIASQN